MKDSAPHGKRFKAFYGKLKRKAKRRAAIRDVSSVLEELIFAILARETTDKRAAEAVRALLDSCVDLNELRVTTPREITLLIGESFPEADAKANEICSVLSEVVQRQKRLDLSPLKSKRLRDAREYLETLGGLSPFAAAWVLSRCLGGHAIPVDQTLAQVLKTEELVDPEAELIEIQAFLERNISSSDAKRHPSLLRDYALSRPKPRKKTVKRTGPAKRPASRGKTRVKAAATRRSKTAASRSKKAKKTAKRAGSSSRTRSRRQGAGASSRTRRRTAAKR